MWTFDQNSVIRVEGPFRMAAHIPKYITAANYKTRSHTETSYSQSKVLCWDTDASTISVLIYSNWPAETDCQSSIVIYFLNQCCIVLKAYTQKHITNPV